jgi:hypothetical protein
MLRGSIEIDDRWRGEECDSARDYSLLNGFSVYQQHETLDKTRTKDYMSSSNAITQQPIVTQQTGADVSGKHRIKILTR